MKNRIARNAAWTIACKVAEAVIALVISMLTARYFGPANYGLINYATSLTSFIFPLAQLGFNATIVQELVSEPEVEGKTLGSAIFASVVSSVMCMIGIALFSRIATPNEPQTVLVCELYSLMLIAQAFELVQYWFQAKLLSKYTAVWALIAYIIMSAYQIYLLASGKSVEWFAVAKALEYALIAAGLLVVYRRSGGARLRVSFRRIGQMLRRSRYYMFSDLIVMTFVQADRIMIKMMMGDTPMGYYSAAVTCANLTQFVFLAIIDSFRPVILELRERDLNAYHEKLSTLYGIVIYLALAQSVGIALLAKPIVWILYGEAYLPSVRVLRLIIWYTTFSYIGTTRNVWILAEEKQSWLWKINLCGAAANILLNGFLIPLWGIEGAAFASLLTQIITNVVIGFILKPIRENNRLMLHGANPMRMLDFLRNGRF